MTDPIPNTTSYSDPIYDRIEKFTNTLGKRWPILVIAFLAAAGFAAVSSSQAANNPDAISAQAFILADQEESTQALIDLANDADITAEFRARAYMELASRALRNGEIDKAVTYCQSGLGTVSDENPGIRASLQLSLAETYYQADELRKAEDAYRNATSNATDLPVQSMHGNLGLAMVLMDSAKALSEEEKEDATAKREEALIILEGLALNASAGAQSLQQLARFCQYSLLREYPELAAEETATE